MIKLPKRIQGVFVGANPRVRPVTSSQKNNTKLVSHREGTSPSPTKSRFTVGETLVVSLPADAIDCSLEKGRLYV